MAQQWMQSAKTRMFAHWRATVIAGVALATLLGGCIGAVSAKAKSPTYTATATLLLTPNSAAEKTVSPTEIQSLIGSTIQTIANIGSTETVLKPVQASTGISVDDLRNDVSVAATLNTSLLTVSATSDSPQSAANIANATAQSVTRSMSNIGLNSQEGTSLVAAHLVDQAAVGSTAESPSTSTWTLIGALIGFLLALLASRVLAPLTRPRPMVRPENTEGSQPEGSSIRRGHPSRREMSDAE